jgi:excisionase family DNA binding protein
MDEHTSTSVAEAPAIGTLYTTADVARLLHISQHTVQAWIRQGLLPAVRYGRVLRVRQADLVAFGQVQPQQTPPAASPDTD